jgi:hypothetical protein
MMLVTVLLVAAAHAQKAAIVFCELDSTLDFKTAKAGDTVSMHTTRDLTDGGKVVLPRGTSIVAKVAGDEDGKSVSLVLDSATLKSGKTVPLMGIIAAVAHTERQDLGGDPFYQMNHSTEVSQHAQQGGGGMDPDAGVASSGAAARTAIMEGENKTKSGLTANSQGAIGISVLELKWVLDRAPATTVFTSKKKNLKIPKGSEMLLRMAPPEM